MPSKQNDQKQGAAENDAGRIHAAAAALGSIPSATRKERCIAALRRRAKPLSDYECTCGAGDSEVVGTPPDGHKTTCRRGWTIYRRMRTAAGKD